MFITIVLFIIGFVLITKGADIFINCTVEIGKKTNISELILGATLVSFATTLPEMTVSLLASIEGHTTMSLGNAVGSIICNTGLVLGLVAFISPFRVDKDMFVSKSTILLLSVVVMIFLGLDGNISRIDGGILLLILALYMYTNYKSVSASNSLSIAREVGIIKSFGIVNNNKGKKSKFTFKEGIKIGAIFLVSLFMMVIGSRLLVNNGVTIAEYIGIPQAVISLTVIALGTSLPELVSSLTAIRKKHHAICVGNILGANILNIVSVIGIAAIPNSIPILSQSIKVDFPFMIALLLTLIIPTIKKSKLYRWQGLIMLLTYFTYLVTLYSMYVS